MRTRSVLLIVVQLLLPAIVCADEREEALFAPAFAAREQAESAQAALLAPATYALGLTALERARTAFDGGRQTDQVQAGITAAAEAFAAAARAAGEAQRTFAGPLARREAARDAEAFRLAGAAWARAETRLGDAARRLEKADADGAIARATEAQSLYDEAELQAIKATVLTEARGLVVGLGPAGTARHAPKTTARAQELLRKAEAELDADRSRRDAAARLATEAATEARHALALAEYLRSAREADTTPEDLALAWETALTRTAVAAGGSASLASGPQAASDEVAKAVSELRARATQQAQDLAQRDKQIASLEEEIRELDRRLAGVSSEARSLTERLEARERARQQFEQLGKAFPTDQATVFRQGDTLIVRAHGLAFASGSASLAPGARPLLDNLREVVSIYPNAQYTVEGHTDSSGDSAANQRLSQSRADAVRRFLVDEAKVPAGRVTAVGYGDSRPIANNETSEGRQLNRRIDLLVAPRGEALP